MEIASTSSNLNMFPTTHQRYGVGYKSTTSSFLRRNPKFRPDRCDVVMETPKKRKYSDEEKPPEKRQRKTIQSRFREPVDTKPITVQSCTTSKTRLHVTETEKSKVNTTKPGDKTENQDHSFKDLIAKALEKVQERRQIDHRNTDITETEKSKVITTKPGDKAEDQEHSFKDLIAKAREKVQEKREMDHRNTDIASQRIAARLALNQMVKAFEFDDHLTYHMELENLGCAFISDQVSCLKKFDLLTRSDYYIDEYNSE